MTRRWFGLLSAIAGIEQADASLAYFAGALGVLPSAQLDYRRGQAPDRGGPTINQAPRALVLSLGETDCVASRSLVGFVSVALAVHTAKMFQPASTVSGSEQGFRAAVRDMRAPTRDGRYRLRAGTWCADSCSYRSPPARAPAPDDMVLLNVRWVGAGGREGYHRFPAVARAVISTGIMVVVRASDWATIGMGVPAGVAACRLDIRDIASLSSRARPRLPGWRASTG